MDESPRIRFDGLGIAAAIFLAANILHTVDHVRQHMAGLNVVIMIGGGTLTAAAVLVTVVALRRDRRAPAAAALVGLVAAALVAASHIVPHWSVISASYLDDVHPDVLSWAVMLLEIGSGLFLAVVGIRRIHMPEQVAATTESAEGTP